MRLLFDVVHHGTRPEVVRTFRPGELLDGRISEDAIPSARLIVNLFDGGPRSEVRFRIGDGPELEMQRSAVADPHFVDLAAHHPGTMKPWVMPTPSSHVWIGELPDDLGAGTYTVTVTAVDEFGRSHHAHRVLEVAGSSAPHSSMPQWVGEGQAPD